MVAHGSQVAAGLFTRLSLGRILVLWALIVPLGRPASAAQFTAFGPRTYQRIAGSPVTERTSFSVLDPSIPYLLRVHVNLAGSAVISLNGIRVVDRSQFVNTALIEKMVTLATINELAVELLSQPGSTIRIEIIGTDNVPPTITATATPGANANGWNQSDVLVRFTCSDATSGVLSCPAPVVVASEGANQVVSGAVVDKAGNTATTSVTLNIDKTAPIVTASQSPNPNRSGWNNGPVLVTFAATDVLSGVAPNSVTAPIALTVDGTDVTASGQAADLAGNVGVTTWHAKIDQTSPSVTVALNPPPTAGGWNNTAVTAHFTCTDAGSSVAACPVDQVVADGVNQVVSGTAIDNAGNVATGTATINIDRAPPVLTLTSPADGAAVFTPTARVTADASDTLSGVAGGRCNGVPAAVIGTRIECEVALTPGTNAVGVTATDAAGNTSTASLSLHYLREPKVTITSPSNLTYLNISPTTVTGTVDDPTATVTINSIPAPAATGSFSIALPLAEGPNVIAATAATADAVGTASLEVTLDTTPPHVTITSPPNGFVTTDASIAVAGNVNDIVVGTINEQQARVTVNGANAQVANRLFLAASVPLTLGPNVIQAVGTDRVGNAATTEITVTRQSPTAQAAIHAISGNNQTGSIGDSLAAPLVVALTDSSGAPVANRPVVFKVAQNDGILSGGVTSGPTAIATTDAQGRAHVQWTLGMRAGAGGNSVEAYAVGFAGTAIFTATGTLGQPAKIVIDTGNDQIGAIGKLLPKPFIAVVVDSGNNRLGGVPVTFTVQQGGGTIDGQPAITVNTDSDGRAAANLTLGLQEGNANNLVVATFPSNQSFPAAFTASGRAPGDPAHTTISGVVLDNSNLPIPGVTMRVVLTNVLNANANAVQSVPAVQTDAQGQFVIPQAPVGFVKLLADGSTAQLAGVYPSLEYDLVTVPGQDNTVGQPIYLLPLNANQLCVTATTGGGTLTIPDAPGFSLTFAPGQVTFPGGSKMGCVNVTAVHGDKVPMVPGFGQQPRFIVTIQPSGAIFNPPAQITLPNVDGLQPRTVTELYSFDHDIGSFVAIGTGVVSDDGQLVRSSPGVGVLKAGWHAGGAPTPTGRAASCPQCTADDGQMCAPVNGACNDGLFCTTQDECSGGGCAGTPVPDVTGPTVAVGVNLDPVFASVKGFLQTLFGNQAPELSLQIAGSVGTVDQCCERANGMRPSKVTQLTGTAGINLELPIPGLAVTLPYGLSGGFFGQLGGSLSGGLARTYNSCTNAVTGSFSGALSLTIGIKAQLTLPANIASASAGGTTGVNCSVTGTPGDTEIDGSATCGHSGVVLSATAQFLNGVIETSTAIVVVEPESLPPLQFVIPIQ